MSKFKIPVVPLNYAVWYAYVAGGNPALKETIDRMVGADQTIDETLTREFDRRYIDPSDQTRAEAAPGRVKRLLEAIRRGAPSHQGRRA